ncbi:MAE_28990/MAE_18760 family HEPN-like nuclease [Synechocystis sp. LKSZ1]|uniref:MAE_28990/MAE_18760 family HEPN-like nuclease n=1 Tax=Synechocystis sp. LKSZ1 TaxID=3144951 RepID=UPI00336BD7B2
MNISDVWAEIEAEQAWRQDEIRFFQNQSTFVAPEKQDHFRRALILLLYAHFEGFCKFVFILYVNNVNSANIRCGEAEVLNVRRKSKR